EDFSDLRNVSLFYLKLQGQFLLPASTTQNIVEEIQNIHELGQTYCLSKLWSLLKNETPLSDEDITNICESVKGFDLFSICHTGPMRTAHSSANLFNYVEPKKIFLGRDENRTDRFAYYVPLRKTLKCLLESDLWKKSGQHTSESPSDILSDINDGRIYKSNNFFVENPSCLKLILYQDAFEVISYNRLWGEEGTHNVCCVRFHIRNVELLLLHITSFKCHYQCITFIKHDIFQLSESKFGELLPNIDVLQCLFITKFFDDRLVPTPLAGDNLGSHCIGGFSENFSRTQHFCRYCLITRSEFQGEDPNVCGPLRTIERYNSALDELQEEPDIEGVKFRSIFNSLKYFYVHLPGLPPCLGHDLFEGIVSYDLALYLKYFIKKKGWFTYSTLNRHIKQFKYCDSDASSKPCEVTYNAAKLSGQAMQNWNLLRLLPLIIGDKVQDTADDVWQLTLQLKDTVELICAQKISLAQIAYLDVVIQEYLETRKLQAYVSAGLSGQTILQIKSGSPFYSTLYSKSIQDAVRQFDFTETNTNATLEILYKGTSYKGQFLVTGSIEAVEFGELQLILINNEAVHVLVSVYKAEF
uniref:Uncharacterized protein n=1 Tax=Poecilia formosa TaxID=48698 RepID=A0A096MAD3_POEFO